MVGSEASSAPVDLVTGGAGFIGSHLAARLCVGGHRVRVADNFSTGLRSRIERLGESIDFWEVDLARDELGGLLRGVRRVFHLAAIPSVPRSVADPIATHEATLTATLRLLVAARSAGVEVIVVASSSSVYGDAPGFPRAERGTHPSPMSPYAVAKLGVEHYSRVATTLYGLSTVCLRYFNVFGEGQDPESPYAAVIPRFIAAALSGEPLQIHGDGRQTRDFTYVANVVDANIAAARSPKAAGNVYNIAAGEPRSILDLSRELERVLGVELAHQYAPERAADVKNSYADISAAARDLNWIPRVGFQEGLRRVVASMRLNRVGS